MSVNYKIVELKLPTDLAQATELWFNDKIRGRSNPAPDRYYAQMWSFDLGLLVQP